MKTKETKGFGVTGISVELSFIELLAIKRLQSQLFDAIAFPGNDLPVAVYKAANFLSRLTFDQLDESIRKTELEIFTDKDAEVLQNECDLNALENETHQ